MHMNGEICQLFGIELIKIFFSNTIQKQCVQYRYLQKSAKSIHPTTLAIIFVDE